MRVMRSILCAGLAIVAMGLCAAMPASAAVPIDIGVAVQMVTKEIHPAPAVHYVLQEVAVLSAIVDTPAGNIQSRSSTGGAEHLFANTSIATPAYQHIDPDIAG